jgi:hypothetical protein
MACGSRGLLELLGLSRRRSCLQGPWKAIGEFDAWIEDVGHNRLILSVAVIIATAWLPHLCGWPRFRPRRIYARRLSYHELGGTNPVEADSG